MKRWVRVVLTILCILMVLSLPFVLSSGAMLGEVKWELMDDEEEASLPLMTLFVSSARAEEQEESFSAPSPSASPSDEAASYSLPVDFSAGMKPNPALFTEDGYEDASITVKMETIEESGVIWRVAHVTIADASQLRTATAGKLTSSAVALPSSMAEKNNAVVAINGDYFSNDPNKTTFEYRMGEKIRAKSNKKKDILIIDENGDFHTFVKSDADQLAAFKASGHTIVNAFTFGPALVQEGLELAMDKEYSYNPSGDEPRAAIGQVGPLSYVLVVAEGRSEDSQGVTHQELADFMYALGCNEAFNLDGGNSATLIFNNSYYMEKSKSNERSLSDIIYFASAVDPSSWQQ